MSDADLPPRPTVARDGTKPREGVRRRDEDVQLRRAQKTACGGTARGTARGTGRAGHG